MHTDHVLVLQHTYRVVGNHGIKLIITLKTTLLFVENQTNVMTLHFNVFSSYDSVSISEYNGVVWSTTYFIHEQL